LEILIFIITIIIFIIILYFVTGNNPKNINLKDPPSSPLLPLPLSSSYNKQKYYVGGCGGGMGRRDSGDSLGFKRNKFELDPIPPFNSNKHQKGATRDKEEDNRKDEMNQGICELKYANE
jgi:hypothetical protein